MTSVNIFFAGVGGQGIITGASLLARAAVASGMKAVMSEVHGMAQRGGSVVCELRLGNVQSPMIPDGQASIIIGFEPVETVRSLRKAHSTTVIVTETRPIVPVSVSLGGTPYPEVADLLAYLRSQVADVYAVVAADIAEGLGMPQSANVVLLGAALATGVLPLSREILEQTIAATVPAKTVDANMRALAAGIAGSRRS